MAVDPRFAAAMLKLHSQRWQLTGYLIQASQYIDPRNKVSISLVMPATISRKCGAQWLAIESEENVVIIIRRTIGIKICSLAEADIVSQQLYFQVAPVVGPYRRSLNAKEAHQSNESGIVTAKHM